LQLPSEEGVANQSDLEVWRDVLADGVQDQQRVHDRERDVCTAIANVKVATRDYQGIMGGLVIEVNPNHSDDAIPGQEQVEPKPPQEPGTLVLHSLNVELKPCAACERQSRAREYPDAFWSRFWADDFLVCPGDVVEEAVSQLSSKDVRRIE
jgi:hypothetical protein